eukprot:TRINITY_DN40645_c0_g1_i1.p1 TRINITY_DN40645_c0_g1~~TRINITY_DN40645_c0_g1_i1.p1  ORF type:complete len:186 (+),score=37.34 TRINITY_DN40645_c0_g1_i1:3-560(+)
MKSSALLLALALSVHGFAAEMEPPKIKGYSIGMPVETALEMNRTLLANFLTKTRQAQSEMVWIGGFDSQTQSYRYNLLRRITGEREPDNVRAASTGNVNRIVFDRLAVALFQIEGVDTRKIIAAFENAYGLSGAKIAPNGIADGLTAVWYLPAGIKITIQCYEDSLRFFSMEKADDDESLRAKLN